MTARLINLDDRRRRVSEYLICTFCLAQGCARVIPKRQYYECPDRRTGCDEEAAVPHRTIVRRK